MDEGRIRNLAVVVEEPGGPSNRYEMDDRRGVIRFAGVSEGRVARPFDQGYFRDVQTHQGGPVKAVVPVRLATFPGCVVLVRPIGMAETSLAGCPVVVGVPAEDPTFESVRELRHLGETWRLPVRAALGEAPLVDASSTRQFLSDLRERGLRARAASRPGGSLPAWKTGSSVGTVPREGASEPHTLAERAIPLLPLRFQEYIERELLDDERILMFIHRPPFTPPGNRLGLRRRRLPEGIFVLTDRQVMFMADALDPDSTMVHWGYIAQVSAVERVAGAIVRADEGALRLEVLVEGRTAGQALRFGFPREAAQALDDAATMLNRFTVSPSQRSLRRVYELPPASAGEAPAWALEGSSEPPLAWAQTRRGDRIVVAPGSLRVMLSRGGSMSASISEIASLELLLALTGCRLRALPAGARQSPEVSFDYPQASDFLSVFTLLRQLLGQPFNGEQSGDTAA